MRSSEHDWYLVSAVQQPHGLTGVVAGAVAQDDGVSSPVLILVVKHPDQMRVEHFHGLAVAIGLHQAHVYRSRGVQGSYHGDPRSHLLLSY